MLEYESQILSDLLEDDSLLIMARGLGVEHVMLNMMKLHCDPANLVLVLNASLSDQDYFIEHLRQQSVTPLPKVINAECGATERKSIYLQGGVLFVSSRILVVDMLTDRVPTALIMGIMVHRAHRVLESCQEAFILRLYRQKNKHGFIRAFSDHADAFTCGFAHVERIMKSLYVRRLNLVPRFHATVIANLERHQPEVVELCVPLTAAMRSCQMALLDLINLCVKELKSCNPGLDLEEITVENVIGKAFDKIVHLQLEPHWHQLGSKTKQLVSDMKTLREILRYLDQYDAIAFFNLVNSIRTSEKTFRGNVGWLFTDAADQLFQGSKERVFGPVADRTRKLKADKAAATEGASSSVTRGSEHGGNPAPAVEENPKWLVLADVLHEIRDENLASAGTPLGEGRVLVAAEDERACRQLREYLKNGGKAMLKRLYDKSQQFKAESSKEQPEASNVSIDKKGKALKRKLPADDNQVTLTQIARGGMAEGRAAAAAAVEEAYATDDEDDDVTAAERAVEDAARLASLTGAITVLHPLHSGGDSAHRLSKILKELEPRYVVLYDADLGFVRQLEVFKANRPGIPLRVYFLAHKDSAEEQRYLTSIRKEKEAFEYLIREKATMVVPEGRSGKAEDAKEDSLDAPTAGSTRKGGAGVAQAPSAQQHKVVVDMREFRSELPSLLHRRGVEVEPVTLAVGDYVLTSDICVERKSVSDLIGSLNNGRLYNQCVAMTRFYKRPILLIEFDVNKSFALQGKYSLKDDISINDVQSRLALLTLHFPKLRILWCQSPYVSADLFVELKTDRDQPDATRAASVGMETASESRALEMSDKYNHAAHDFLLKVPGVTSKNASLVMNKVRSIAELSQLSEPSLAATLGNAKTAKDIWNFFHAEYKPEVKAELAAADDSTTAPSKSKKPMPATPAGKAARGRK